MKVTIIRIVVGALGKIPRELGIGRRIETIQTTTILKSFGALRKVGKIPGSFLII